MYATQPPSSDGREPSPDTLHAIASAAKELHTSLAAIRKWELRLQQDILLARQACLETDRATNIAKTAFARIENGLRSRRPVLGYLHGDGDWMLPPEQLRSRIEASFGWPPGESKAIDNALPKIAHSTALIRDRFPENDIDYRATTLRMMRNNTLQSTHLNRLEALPEAERLTEEQYQLCLYALTYAGRHGCRQHRPRLAHLLGVKEDEIETMVTPLVVSRLIIWTTGLHYNYAGYQLIEVNLPPPPVQHPPLLHLEEPGWAEVIAAARDAEAAGDCLKGALAAEDFGRAGEPAPSSAAATARGTSAVLELRYAGDAEPGPTSAAKLPSGHQAESKGIRSGGLPDELYHTMVDRRQAPAPPSTSHLPVLRQLATLLESSDDRSSLTLKLALEKLRRQQKKGVSQFPNAGQIAAALSRLGVPWTECKSNPTVLKAKIDG